MHIFHKHFKYNDSWMWCDWVRHQPIFGFPHLRIASVFQGLYFIFEFTWGKLHWYWTTGNVKYKAQKGEEV